MSVAFTREEDAEAVAANLPDRPVPSHPNLVTAAGLAAIEAALAAARAAQAKALASAGLAADRTPMAQATRELRYWSARRASAQLVETPVASSTVVFGSRVEIERVDGRRQRWHIVGDDEADPAKGSVSWVSPLARALTGKQVGETVRIAGEEAEILAIG